MGIKERFIQRWVEKQINKLKKEKPQMFKWLEGKKSYLVAIAIFILGGLQASGVTIPEWVYAILGALGLGALRAGIASTKNDK